MNKSMEKMLCLVIARSRISFGNSLVTQELEGLNFSIACIILSGIFLKRTDNLSTFCLKLKINMEEACPCKTLHEDREIVN